MMLRYNNEQTTKDEIPDKALSSLIGILLGEFRTISYTVYILKGMFVVNQL